ncbi:MMPL family transporter [Halorussus salilacus]|uniref:efflux RND transporter permease subunit n=1 Tax=Halorussus salilacus TaxID=2953750 RepID=UPI00209D3BB2|nr:MMPL family transporter [Halorussus salilacus]USZ69560.1 MMPL family transporter [Halorussus salilacus]
MARDIPNRFVEFVTTHNRIVVVAMLLLTAVVAGGVTQLDLQSSGDADSDAFGDTEVAQKSEYISEHYTQREDDPGNTTTASVYVREEDGNVLSKRSLLESLRYQREVRDNESVNAALASEDGAVGVSNVIAKRAAGDPAADLDAQIEALDAASDDEVERLVSETLAEGSAALGLLPDSYEPGSTTAESRRITFEFEAADTESGVAQPPADAQRALYEAASDRGGEGDGGDYFTLGEFASASYYEQQSTDTIELILPAALLFILGALGFAYRDLADVVVGFVGVVVSVLWMFGILGWLEIPAGMTLIIGPVLITGLSIDYGLHVFMRYREQRGADEGVGAPMTRAVSSVGVAFVLVTVTAAVGFLSNLANPFGMIRDLGVGITLGVVSALVVFTTLVPALKVSVDGLLERVGFDRRKSPLGTGRYLRPVLGAGVDAARKAAPLVIVVALVAGAGGAVAWTDIDRQGYQTSSEVAEWKTELPGPLAWEATDDPYYRNQQYVEDAYQSTDRNQRTTTVLVEGDVTDPSALDRVADGVDDAQDSDAVFRRGERAEVVSPLSVMESVAAEDERFAGTFRDADTDGDGVPDRDLEAVYGALYEAAPERAGRVVERRDGEYRSLRLLVPVEQGLEVDERATAMHGVAGTVEGGPLTATAVGQATFSNAELGQLADGIFRTMLLALVAVAVVLAVGFRLTEGSATLGALTAVPIALVVGLVLGGMYLTGTPITFVTALLMSLVVGLGVDYNIHVSDRFAQELDRGRDPVAALRTAVTRTGGALLGSTLTSGGAFATLLLHVSPQIRGFGMLVVLGLSLSFVVSVFVLPSMLLAWSRRVGVASMTGRQGVDATPDD